jgi:imidazolonepropionase-like amidohydrolase
MVKPHHRESIRMAREAGVLIAAGTDAGTPFNLHGRNLNEIKLLVDYGGLAPMAAIEAGTRIAARVLGVENELGTVAAGKIADLVLVAGNPLEDIGVLTAEGAMRLVMQGGKIVAGDF